MKLHLLLPLILVSTKLIEVAMGRARIPAVVGAILAGVVLGPMVLDLLPSETSDPKSYHVLHQLAQIGLGVLLFKIGQETQFADFLPVWRAATGIALAGSLLPLALGWTTAILWGWPMQAAVFMGAALTATSIGVTASVLSEMEIEHSREGILILAGAVLDDVLGLLLLSSLVAYMSPDVSVGMQVLTALGQALLFIVAGVILGPHIVRLIIWAAVLSRSRGFLLVFAFAYFLLLAYIAKWIGLDMIIGAYAAGIAFARYPERHQLERDLEPLIELLTPIFFVMLGAAVELSGFNPLSPEGRQIWLFTVVVFAVAVVGKLFSACWMRDRQINVWAIGSGMMPRGEVGFVFAQIGLLAGVFSGQQFSVLVAVLIATTLVGPLMLRASWKSAS